MSKKINIATIYYVYWLYIKFDYITVLRWLKCNLSERQSCVFFLFIRHHGGTALRSIGKKVYESILCMLARFQKITA